VTLIIIIHCPIARVNIVNIHGLCTRVTQHRTGLQTLMFLLECPRLRRTGSRQITNGCLVNLHSILNLVILERVGCATQSLSRRAGLEVLTGVIRPDGVSDM